MFPKLTEGLSAETNLTVQEEHTAARWGSGGLLVFSTPHMIGLMESAAVKAVDPLLPAGYQTVGIRVDVQHLAATPVGASVVASAKLVAIEDRKLTFALQAHDASGKIGEGMHQRFIVEVERFMAKAAARS